jgi:hypothetical protein
MFDGVRLIKQMEKHGNYTIATVYSVKDGLISGKKICISFKYKGVTKKLDGDRYLEEFIGKRIFIQFQITDNGISYGESDCIVPDSITEAPPEGWSKKWMKQHFPDCSLLNDTTNPLP